MLGTGTQEFPYIPENWDEFVTAVGISEAYVSLPAGGGTYDMNEIAPEGNFSVSIICKQINGNGWTIRNSFNVFFVTSADCICDLNFLNFYIDISEDLFHGNGTVFDNCKFSGIIATIYDPFSRVHLNRCSIHCNFIGDAGSFLSPYSECSFCNILLDYNDTQKTSIYMELNGDYNFYEYRIKDGVTTETVLIGKANVWHENGDGGLVTDTNNKIYKVTDEQLRDAEYLRSIGFPVV